MAKFDSVQLWLDNVTSSHSRCKQTGKIYRVHLNKFAEFAETTPERIMREYEGSNERMFRRKYALMLKAWQAKLTKKYSPCTVSNHVNAVESFFKYADLPIGFVPKTRRDSRYHNKDIEKEEIVQILEAARPREKAFFAFMVQSGLRPETIALLQLKDMPELKEGKVANLVRVPKDKTKGKYGAYFTFIGEDALRMLNAYLATRSKLMPKSNLFAAADGEGSIGTSQPSHVFTNIVRKLRESGKIDYELRKNRKPSELRLYTLRKYFRYKAMAAGPDNVNFWMGHRIGGSDDLCFSKQNIEEKRKIYIDQALPHLRLESATATEADKLVQTQQKEIETLKAEVVQLKQDNQKYASIKDSYDALQKLLKRVEVLEKKLAETPTHEHTALGSQQRVRKS